MKKSKEFWAAKDANGCVFLYSAKPVRSLETKSWYMNKEDDLYSISNRLFPELTWEDEPVKVSITIKK